jgi:hypothetical protein
LGRNSLLRLCGWSTTRPRSGCWGGVWPGSVPRAPTAGAYLVLGGLLYTGAMPLALAGVGAVAMRTASGAVSSTLYAANRLLEHSFYLDMLASCLTQARGYRRPAGMQRLPRDPQLIEVHGVRWTPEPSTPSFSRCRRFAARARCRATAAVLELPAQRC